MFYFKGNDSPNISKLASETQVKETSLIDNNSSNFVNQPSGFICTRKAFRLSDFITSIFRQFRISFIAQLSTFLFMPIVLTLFFALLSNVMAFQSTERSKCSLSINSIKTTNCTVENPLLLYDPELRNIFYISLVLLVTGLLMITTTTILYTKHLKIFQREHRNCE